MLDIKHGDAKEAPQIIETHPFYLTRKEVAEKLRITLVTVDKYTKAGIIKAYRIGGQIRYKAAEIDKSFEVVKTAKYKREA